MFLVNGAAAVLYAITAAIWYWFFFNYALINYNASATKVDKNKAKQIAMKAWMVSNVTNFFA